MKIILPDEPSTASPSKRAANAAIKLLEGKPIASNTAVIKAIRSACSQAYSDAMNGHRGETVDVVTGEYLVRATLGTIHTWTVEVWHKQT